MGIVTWYDFSLSMNFSAWNITFFKSYYSEPFQKVWFGSFIQWHINIHTKAIFVEEK